jgi:hypothetical protein
LWILSLVTAAASGTSKEAAAAAAAAPARAITRRRHGTAVVGRKDRRRRHLCYTTAQGGAVLCASKGRMGPAWSITNSGSSRTRIGRGRERHHHDPRSRHRPASPQHDGAVPPSRWSKTTTTATTRGGLGGSRTVPIVREDDSTRHIPACAASWRRK